MHEIKEETDLIPDPPVKKPRVSLFNFDFIIPDK
jgi:hypothetical protein